MQTFKPLRFKEEPKARGERFSVCRSILRDMMGDVQITLSESDECAMQGLFWRYVSLSLTTLSFPPTPFTITARGSNTPGMLMLRAMEGVMLVSQTGKRVTVPQGDVLLVKADTSLVVTLSAGGRLDCAHIPGHALGNMRKQFERLLMSVVPSSCLPLQLLVTYAGYMLQHDYQNERDAEMMVDHFYALLPVLAEHLTRGDTPDQPRSRADSVKARVERHLSDSALSVEHIARAEGVSARAIQKIFSREDTTFSRYLLERRLELAKARILLNDRTNSIGDVAFSVGFNDPSYFSRTFRKRYGIRPTDLKPSPARSKDHGAAISG